MNKVRVYEVAKQLGLDPKAVVALFQQLGVSDVKNHMSSVDNESVERVKRHLEKPKASAEPVAAAAGDEQRIRPTVVKRKARPTEGSVPSPTGSSASLSDAASIPEAAPSYTQVPHAPASVRDVAPVPAPKASVRDVAPAPAPSVREVAATAPSVHEVPAAPPSVHDVQSAPTAPAEPPVAPVAAPVEAPPAPAPEPVAARPAPPPVVAPAPIRREQPAPNLASQRPSNGPKTGVEYWTGRPGVPMPAPTAAGRPGAGSAMGPRRVQFETRGPGGAPIGAPGQGLRPGLRPGQAPYGRPPMGGRFGGPGGGKGRNSPPSMLASSKRAPNPLDMAAHKRVIRIEENVTLQSLAASMSLKATEVLMKLLSMGMTGVHINSRLDADTAKILASEFGWEVEDVAVSDEDSLAAARGEKAKDDSVDLEPRSPVVTVMGHVDHGKTSLLDRIRRANVAAGEAGGITQHIGAYKVQTSQGTLVFLDTPGHEAFTAMRARGASVTDIVVLVVAADDGVMPQTKEAVSHAKAAKVPIIVAVNKCDKAGAEPDRVRRELTELGLMPEEWGGDTIFVNVSAQTGEGIETLLENLGVQAEILELRASPTKPATGTVIEALLDRGRGPVARVLVQQGTLKVGDFVLAGMGFGKVRAMTNEHGKQLHAAGPSTPVEILGLSDVPNAGDPIDVVRDTKKAQEIAEQRKAKASRSLIPASAKVSLEELSKRISEQAQCELRIIIKGDVQGSVEATAEALGRLSGEKVKLTIVHSAVGAITEGDVNLAIAARAILVGFNVRPAGKAAALAEENRIEIRLYSIIYNAVDDVKSAMEGLLPPTLVEKACGKAEVRAVFKLKVGTIAGCYVVQGTMKRAGKVRVLRDGAVLQDGKMGALKRFKDDAKEVAEGFECGISIDGFADFREGDMIECYEIEEIKQSL
jgi:translation initiation factor IF-2